MNLQRTEYGVAVELPTGETLLIRHIIGVGMNYAAHAAEQGKGVPERPVLFTKNPGAACLSGDDIVIPRACRDRPQVDFEAELGVIIGRRPDGSLVKDVSRADALSCVLGYVAANDVSARWWQKEGSGGQFNRGKSFDTFCPMGPRVVPAAQIGNPGSLRVVCRLNGQTMQDAPTSDMIFDVPTLVHEISRDTTLLPGTLILTGTPSGVGMARSPQRFLAPGDVVEVEISDIGVVTNRVRE
ncbi:MAG: fumarylacetoacetate hydrolase family protein [Phycisphaeraceae bacterium]|nr:fumarylacetoacetate hydrolase family protein [Phycisphaeraceae bacterium]